MAYSILLAVTFGITFSLGSHRRPVRRVTALAVAHHAVGPSWRADLRPVIREKPLGIVLGRGRETELSPKTSLWFLSNNALVATFVTRAGGASLSRHGGAVPSSPLLLRAFIFNASSGEVTATAAWPVESRDAGIVAAHDGNFVTQAGGELTLYSADLKRLKELTLPRVEDTFWVPSPSPTGKSVLFVAGNQLMPAAFPWVWVDTDNLRIVRSWREVQSGYVGISDSTIVMTKCVWFYRSTCQPRVEARTLNTPWRPLATASPQDNEPHPRFVNDGLLLLQGNPIRLMYTDGALVFTEDLWFDGCSWGAAVTSSGGRRFAIPSCKLRGAFPSLDIGGTEVLKRIILYDSPFRGPSYVLDLKGPAVKGEAKVALSPDGSKLGVLNKEHLELFQLPPAR